MKWLISYYFHRTQLTTCERRNRTIKGQIIVPLNEAPDRQAQVATDIELRPKSYKKRCNKINNHLYYVVDSREFLTGVVIKDEALAVQPTVIVRITRLKPKQAKIVKKLFSFTA